jgi:hypothetical protein
MLFLWWCSFKCRLYEPFSLYTVLITLFCLRQYFMRFVFSRVILCVFLNVLLSFLGVSYAYVLMLLIIVV